MTVVIQGLKGWDMQISAIRRDRSGQKDGLKLLGTGD